METVGKYYFVFSPEYSYVEPVLDYGQGPTYHTADTIYVIAKNKTEAKKYAVKSKEFKPWVTLQRDDNKNPFSGINVIEVSCEEYLSNILATANPYKIANEVYPDNDSKFLFGKDFIFPTPEQQTKRRSFVEGFRFCQKLLRSILQ